jgi:hypothetical protein
LRVQRNTGTPRRSFCKLSDSDEENLEVSANVMYHCLCMNVYVKKYIQKECHYASKHLKIFAQPYSFYYHCCLFRAFLGNWRIIAPSLFVGVLNNPKLIQFFLFSSVRINSRLTFNVADPDPGSGAFLTPGSGIRDGYKIRIRDPDPG